MDEVGEVKSRLEITEVVGGYLPLKQAGRNLKAPCPFHEEKSASFMVSPEKGIYHCFGCGEGGDIFNFVMKMEGVDFRTALEMLARKAGVELVAKSGENKSAQRMRDRLLAAHELAAKYFQATLVKNPKAVQYVVKQRRLGKETIRNFQIGYAPDSWGALTDFLLGQGFTQGELLQGGLAGQKDGRSTIYDLFRGRVMFTICDREGRAVGFTGRVLDDSLPKYLNTPQTPLYDKSQAIYGLHLAKEAIRSGDEAVLVEGNMDVVASHQAGVKQVVAASGTALTLDQLRTLSKLTKNIKLAFDSDRAGLAATERAIELGQKLGLTLRMVVLPAGYKDADQLVQTDPQLWRTAIAEAQYIVDYLFERFERDFDLATAVGKRGYADRLAGNLRRLGDPVEQDHYVKLLAEKTGVSEAAVRAKIEKVDEAAQGGSSVRDARAKGAQLSRFRGADASAQSGSYGPYANDGQFRDAGARGAQLPELRRTDALGHLNSPSSQVSGSQFRDAGTPGTQSPELKRTDALSRSGSPGGQSWDVRHASTQSSRFSGADASGHSGAHGSYSTDGQPTRRAVMQAPRRSPVRIQHEELLLGLNLLNADARASLHDLAVEDFSSTERKIVYEYLKKHSSLRGDKLAEKMPEAETYAKGLLLVAEEEYTHLEAMELLQIAFELARTVQLESNAEKKLLLSAQLREAETDGNEKLRTQLLRQFQSIIESEA